MTHKKKILIVDDEPSIRELLQYNLEAGGFSVIQAETGTEALLRFAEHTIDGVILDLMLPDMDGLDVLRRIRQDSQNPSVPVIMLTVKSEEVDKIIGLELGADDYLAKPFGVRELLARLKAILRRTSSLSPPPSTPKATPENDQIQISDMMIQERSRSVHKAGQEVELTLKEYELLVLLAKHPGQVYSREDLLTHIWGYDYLGETRTVDVHIRQLRRKLEDDDSNPQIIKTVRGIGYKISGGHGYGS